MNLPKILQQKITEFTPQYNELKFDSSEEFLKWLKEKTKTEIFFKDTGQDLIKFHVDEFGEILHTELASLGSIYNGSLLLDDTELLLEGDNISVWVTMFREVSTFKYEVKEVIRY
ncbi:MAG: hypothetical protein REI96_06185 [Flavobacterium nitrogenifigens]|uniref:hypothetical protein n=1 Tax=Flavobacterium nitrogenifigens TaxID=1617283 RepID=UPI0028095B2B|nr:hypothetical protein [Flavobacterium nitrogenifigens]MDQ8012015.1 hypothetical protein [Flavobacterium nitrogenifigens]